MTLSCEFVDHENETESKINKVKKKTEISIVMNFHSNEIKRADQLT